MTSVSVTKNTTYLTLSYIGQKVLSFFYFVMVARMIGVEDLGKYTFALSFTTLFAVFVDLGLTQALIRESAKFKDKAKNYLSSVLGVKLAFSFLIYFVVVLVVNLMGYPEITRQLVYVAGLLMVIDQFTLTFWGVFRGHRNLKYEAISVVINQAIIVSVGVTVLLMKLPLIYLMLPFILGSSFSLIFSVVSVWKVLGVKANFKVDKKVLFFLIKLAIPFALIAIFSRVYGYIDSIMLSKIIGDKAVGWYSVAMKIPFALQFIPAALAAAIFPAFSHHFLHNKDQLRITYERVLRFLIIIVMPISVGVAILAKPVILTLYGEGYSPSIIPLQIMMLGLFFVFLNFPVGSLLNGCNKQVANTVLVGSTMVVNIILNVFLIPTYSFVGASIAFLISHSFLFIVGSILARQITSYDLKSFFMIIIKALTGALAMGGVIWLLRDRFHFVLLILFGALVYFVVMFLIRGLRKKDVQYFIDVFIRRKEGV